MTDEIQVNNVFFVSDRTGKTAEAIGLSLLSQFDQIEFEYKSYSFVTTREDANRVVTDIQKITQFSGTAPIVISTIVDRNVESIFSETDACLISLYNAFIGQLEDHMQLTSTAHTGRAHEEFDDSQYARHIDAIEFTLRNDDGMTTSQLDEADIIIIGVSRCAKTPTCLYLAMNFSVKAANYPLTEDDLDKSDLPDFLRKHKGKMVGLTIRPDQLSAIRQQRRPNSPYASIERCKKEVRAAEEMMHRAGLTIFDSTSTSIEEIAVKIAKEKELLTY